jgi:hypothetical protein
MSPTRLLRSPAMWMAYVVLLSVQGGVARADDGCAWCGLFHFGCSSPTITYTRTTHFNYKCICPKPVCDPCNLEHYGYYPTCWHPWPFPQDYRHCQSPNAACGSASPVGAGTTPAGAGTTPLGPMPPASDQLPEPRKENGGPVVPPVK